MFLVTGWLILIDVDFIRSTVYDHLFLHRILHSLYNCGHGHQADDPEHHPKDCQRGAKPVGSDFPQSNHECV